MSQDDIQPEDVVEYLVGVFKTVTSNETVQAVLPIPDLVEVVNQLIAALSPIVAYHLAHGHHSYDRPATQDGDGNLKSN